MTAKKKTRAGSRARAVTARKAPARPPRSRARRGTAPERLAEERVLLALRRVLTHLPARAFRPQASLVGELGVDSLKVAELSIALEDTFGRPVFLGEVFAGTDEPGTLTVAQLARFLAKEEKS